MHEAEKRKNLESSETDEMDDSQDQWAEEAVKVEEKKTKHNTKANAKLEVKDAELDLSTEKTEEEEDKKKANPKSKPKGKGKEVKVKEKKKAEQAKLEAHMEMHNGASGSKDFVKTGENGKSKNKGKGKGKEEAVEQKCKPKKCKPKFRYTQMLYKKQKAFGIRRQGGKQIFQIRHKDWTVDALRVVAVKIVTRLNSGSMDEEFAKLYSHCKLLEIS
jgi:hypothetical protein